MDEPLSPFLQAMLEEEEKMFHEIRCEGVAVCQGLIGMAIAIRERWCCDIHQWKRGVDGTHGWY